MENLKTDNYIHEAENFEHKKAVWRAVTTQK